jgi:hypothetical protein
MAVIPAGPSSIIVSIEYPGDDSSRWARLYDNRLQGLIVDETGAAEAKPVLVGSLPLAATDTTPILSPQWAIFDDPMLIVPDMLRGRAADFFTWLATNNGANRPLQARFGISSALHNAFEEWSRANPELTFADDPPEPPAAAEEERGQ